MTLPPHVTELASSVASDHGVEVLEVCLRPQRRAPVLQVILDSEAPVEADVVERVSRDLSVALDAADPVSGRYTLEVSTPGLQRPLRRQRDFQRQVGHRVKILRTTGGDDTPRTVQGDVVAVDETRVTLRVGEKLVLVPLADVVRGTVVLPW